MITSDKLYNTVSYVTYSDGAKVAKLSADAEEFTAWQADGVFYGTGVWKQNNGSIGVNYKSNRYQVNVVPADSCKVFFIDADGNISASSVSAIATDSDDYVSVKMVNGEATCIVINSLPKNAGNVAGPVGGGENLTTSLAADQTAGSKALKGSKANAAWKLNDKGLLSVTVDYTAPEWAAEGTIVTMNLQANYLGSPIVGVNPSVSGKIENGKATLKGSVANISLLYYVEDANDLGFTVTGEALGAVKAYWVDQTGKEITALTNKTETVSTSRASAAKLIAKLPNTATGDVVSATASNLMEVVAAPGPDTAYSTLGTVAYSTLNTGWDSAAKTVYATTSLPVVITLNLSNLANTYSVANAYKTAAALAMPTGYTANTLKLDLSRDSSIEAGGKVVIQNTTTLGNALPTDKDGLKVTLSTGNELYFVNDNTTKTATIIGDNFFFVNKGQNETVTVTKVEKVVAPVVAGVKYNDEDGGGDWDANETITITFSGPVNNTAGKVTATPAGGTLAVDTNTNWTWNTEKTEVTIKLTGVPAATNTIAIAGVEMPNVAIKSTKTCMITFNAGALQPTFANA